MISRELINTIQEPHLKQFLNIHRLLEDANGGNLTDFVIQKLEADDIFKNDFDNFLKDYFQVVNNTKLFVYKLNYSNLNNIAQFILENTNLFKINFSFFKGFLNENNSLINSEHVYKNSVLHKSILNVFLKNITTKSKTVALTTTVTINYTEKYVVLSYPARLINQNQIKPQIILKETTKLFENLFIKDKMQLLTVATSFDNNFLKNGLFKLYTQVSKPIEENLINSLPKNINKNITDLLAQINLKDNETQLNLIKNVLYQSLGDKNLQQNIGNYKNGWIFWLAFSDKLGTNVNTRDIGYNPIYMTDVFWNVREYIKKTINEIGFNCPLVHNTIQYTSKANYSTFRKVLEINLYALKKNNNNSSTNLKTVSDYNEILILRKKEFEDVERKIKTIL